jgi:hypothetical protein
MIFTQLTDQLISLTNLLVRLSDSQYTRRVEHLAGASIGEHTRHIIELLQCAVNGYHTGEVDYLNRRRNLELEKDKNCAVSVLCQIALDIRQPDMQLKLTTEQPVLSSDMHVYTTWFREIVYNTEHAIHHLALVRVALIEMNLDLVEKDFGVAYSTLKFRTTLVSA